MGFQQTGGNRGRLGVVATSSACTEPAPLGEGGLRDVKWSEACLLLCLFCVCVFFIK